MYLFKIEGDITIFGGCLNKKKGTICVLYWLQQLCVINYIIRPTYRTYDGTYNIYLEGGKCMSVCLHAGETH